MASFDPISNDTFGLELEIPILPESNGILKIVLFSSSTFVAILKEFDFQLYKSLSLDALYPKLNVDVSFLFHERYAPL